MNAEQMRIKLHELKNEAQSLLDANQIQDAESKTFDIKMLAAQLEIQEKLDVTNEELETVKNQITAKDESINSLNNELETTKTENKELMDKYTTATETVAELKSQVSVMQPIVDSFNEEQQNKLINETKTNYKAKFEKVGGLEVFESEEVQNLVLDTLNKDETISNKAKISLSDKLMEVIDGQDSLVLNSVQEPLKGIKNLIPTDDEFEKTYGFKKE